MVILATILIQISLNPASGRTAPVQLLRRPQRTAQVVGEGFGFHVVVVPDVGVVDRDAGAVGTGPGSDVEVGGLVGVAAGGELAAGCVGSGLGDEEEEEEKGRGG